MVQEILNILREAGDRGLSLRKIVLHVYNQQNDLFHTVSMQETKMEVKKFLLANSRKPNGLVERVRRGVYRLNRKACKCNQFLLQFDQDEDQDVAADSGLNSAPQEGPSLFD